MAEIVKKDCVKLFLLINEYWIIPKMWQIKTEIMPVIIQNVSPLFLEIAEKNTIT